MDQSKTGRLIAALRRKRGMTQKELAQQLGVTDRAVSKWENGRGLPELELMLPLGTALECSVEELLRGEQAEVTGGQAEGSLQQEYEKLLAARKRWKRAGKAAAAALVVCGLLLTAALVCNRTFWRSSYQAEHYENVCISVPRFSFYRSEGGLETHLVKLKTLRQPDEVEIFIDRYLAGFEPVAGESGIYYYNRAKNFTIWQYRINNDGIGFVNTIYLGYADGRYVGAI